MSSSDHRARPHTDDLRPLPQRILRLLRPLGAAHMRRRWELEVHGEHHVPRTGPVLLACNHIGWLDGPLIVATAPRPVHALTKDEMFVGRTGLLLRAAGQIPIDRFSNDTAAVRKGVRALRDGRTVAIFPEGKRGTGEIARMKRGLAYFALVTGAPIVPVAIFGTRHTGEKTSTIPPNGRRLAIVYGEPLSISAQPWPRRKQAVAQVTRDLQASLLSHLQAAKELTGAELPAHARDERAPDSDTVALSDADNDPSEGSQP